MCESGEDPATQFKMTVGAVGMVLEAAQSSPIQTKWSAAIGDLFQRYADAPISQAEANS